jgi:hypothetical protein
MSLDWDSKVFLNWNLFKWRKHSPTIPNVIQRIAATMGCGIAANTPPNFPAEHHIPVQYCNMHIENTDVTSSRIFSNSLHNSISISEHNSLQQSTHQKQRKRA